MNNHSSSLNRLLTIFFAIILLIQIGYLLVGFASNLVFFQRVTTETIEPVVYYGQVQISNELVAKMAAERGLSLVQYATYRIIVNSLAGLIPIGVAALIIWRAGGQWFAWYTAFILVFLGETAFSEQTLVSQFISVEAFGANAIFWFLVLPYLFLFPNGKAVPRRAAWLVGTLVAFHFFVQVGTVIAYVLPDLATRFSLPNWGNSKYVWPVLLNFLIILVCQVYRYRRASTSIERKQTKWFLFGFGLMVALIPVVVLTEVAGRTNDIQVVLWLPLSFSLAIAITRYRLFDIDVIIRRTLVYAALTLTLALVYFGSVILLQNLFTAVGGQQSAVVTVISTLLIAALFTPLRRRIQRDIDRRFYRKKYDAEKIVAAFGAGLREQVDLEQLSERLVAVVEETLQPETINLLLMK